MSLRGDAHPVLCVPVGVLGVCACLRVVQLTKKMYSNFNSNAGALGQGKFRVPPALVEGPQSKSMGSGTKEKKSTIMRLLAAVCVVALACAVGVVADEVCRPSYP